MQTKNNPNVKAKLCDANVHLYNTKKSQVEIVLRELLPQEISNHHLQFESITR